MPQQHTCKEARRIGGFVWDSRAQPSVTAATALGSSRRQPNDREPNGTVKRQDRDEVCDHEHSRLCRNPQGLPSTHPAVQGRNGTRWRRPIVPTTLEMLVSGDL